MILIGKDFALPDEAITETFAILAKRGVGKTYLASVVVEGMLKNGLPVCVIDPTGAWWGLRASADGLRPGLPVVVLGGDHGDLPLTVSMAEGIARLLAEKQTPMVIDLSLFTKGDRVRFMAIFAETLYRLNRRPLHLVLDEADRFAPQKPMPDQQRMLGAIDEIVRMGRLRGLGVTMITQRPAVLNKDVLTQIEVLVTLRMTAPQDQKAIDAWVEHHGSPEQRAELMKSLPSLPIGTAWFWSPGWLNVFQKVKVRERTTFNSSATPKIGEVVAQPRTLAEIDLEHLRETLAVEIEKAEGADVAALQRKVADLQRQLREKPKVEEKRIEIPIIRDDQIDELKALGEQLTAKAGEMIDQAQQLLAFGQDIVALLARARQPAPPARPEPTVPMRGVEGIIPGLAPSHRAPKPPPTRANNPPGEDNAPKPLRSGAIRILKAIAQRHPTPLTRTQIATLSGFAPSGGTFSTYIGDLRRLGYIDEYDEGTVVSMTGFEFLGDDIPPQPQTTNELLAMWRQSLRAGAFRMLEELVNLHPEGYTRTELGEITSFTVTGGTFSTYLGDLRRNALIEERGGVVYASDSLFLDGVPSR